MAGKKSVSESRSESFDDGKSDVILEINDSGLLDGGFVSELKDFTAALKEHGLSTNGLDLSANAVVEIRYTGRLDIGDLLDVLDIIINDYDLCDHLEIQGNILSIVTD